MQLTWDPRKSEENRRNRGFDFAFAALVFNGFVAVTQSHHRREYGEVRLVAVGVVDGLEITVVYTDRQNDKGEIERRIISARRSSKKERKVYEERAAKHG